LVGKRQGGLAAFHAHVHPRDSRALPPPYRRRTAQDRPAVLEGTVEEVHGTFDPAIGIQLLADIRTAFEAFNTERMTSATMIAELVKDEEGPWLRRKANNAEEACRLAQGVRDTSSAQRAPNPANAASSPGTPLSRPRDTRGRADPKSGGGNIVLIR